MAASARRSMGLIPVIAVATTGLVCWKAQSAGESSMSYYPVYLELIGGEVPQLNAFPTVGPKLTVALPAGLPKDLRLIDFSPDGKAIYVQRNGYWDCIIKIEFAPARQSIVPGSVGLGTIGSLVVLHKPERVIVSGVAKVRGKIECGVFELDPAGGDFRHLFDGKFSDCGGFISPDGTRILRLQGNHLSVLDLGTRAVQTIGDGLTWAAWSPDGRWITAILNYRRIVLIDATDTSTRRDLGRTEDNQARWSPDSKYLLLVKGELRCGSVLSSLEAIDVLTGKRSLIKSSHCNIVATSVGWMDSEAVR
jgi:hypothetical protein